MPVKMSFRLCALTLLLAGRISSAFVVSYQKTLLGCSSVSKPLSSLPAASIITALRAASTEELTPEEDALIIKRLEDEVMEISGVELEQLLSPAKVVNLEREIFQLKKELETTSNQARAAEIEEEIATKQTKANGEKRMYVQGWLKTLFVGQSVLSVVVAGFLSYGIVPFVEDVDISVRVLGFWFIWLFTIPSLRARKPAAGEKEALNWAFGLTPLTNLLAPFVTKDPVLIYWANLVVTAACYGYGLLLWKPSDAPAEADTTPGWVKDALKALDYGSGRERGARK